MKHVLDALLPSREDLRLMVNVEDRFDRPHMLRELILAWHHGRERPISDIAVAWGIPTNRLRRWMEWYQITELVLERPDSPPQPKPDPRPKPNPEPDTDSRERIRPKLDLTNVTLRSTTPANVALKIEREWDRTRSWDAVAATMQCTKEELRVWVKQRLGQGLFILTSSTHLRILLDASAPQASAKKQESV